MRYLAACVLLVMFSLVSVAEDSSKNLLPGFSVEEKQAGKFVQERWLTILNQPLISNGLFSIEKNVSIVWRLRNPFELTYFFDGKILQISESGVTKEVGRKEDPMLYGFFSFFFKIFSLSYDEMSEWFEISYDVIDDSRHINLLPKKLFMKKSFQNAVVIESKGIIQSITIFEAKGDKLHLQFSYTR